MGVALSSSRPSSSKSETLLKKTPDSGFSWIQIRIPTINLFFYLQYKMGVALSSSRPSSAESDSGDGWGTQVGPGLCKNHGVGLASRLELVIL